MSERLAALDKDLAAQVRVVLEKNKAERHIRGGEATLRKYKYKAMRVKKGVRAAH